MKNDLNYAVELIRKADGILITAGAGMSVDSGLPDFRSVSGFWNALKGKISISKILRRHWLMKFIKS